MSDKDNPIIASIKSSIEQVNTALKASSNLYDKVYQDLQTGVTQLLSDNTAKPKASEQAKDLNKQILKTLKDNVSAASSIKDKNDD